MRVTLCVQAASPSPWSKSLYQQLDCGYVITYIYTGHNPSVSWSVYFSSFCILTVTDLVNRATVCMHTVWWRSPSHDTASVAGCLNSQFTRVTAQWNKAALLIEDQSSAIYVSFTWPDKYARCLQKLEHFIVVKPSSTRPQQTRMQFLKLDLRCS